MKPNEHEYKGLWDLHLILDKYSKMVYDDVFKYFKGKKLQVLNKNRPKISSIIYGIRQNNNRFDNIAGAVQILVENISEELVNKFLKYNLNSFSISGGVSMNIKMNKHLSTLSFVKNLYVPPTELDESLSIGVCYYLNSQYKTNKILNNLLEPRT